jgi:hypothetical protein
MDAHLPGMTVRDGQHTPVRLLPKKKKLTMMIWIVKMDKMNIFTTKVNQKKL